MHGNFHPTLNVLRATYQSCPFKTAPLHCRAGFLVLESCSLGWRPLRDSFMASMPRDVYDADKVGCVRDMFDWLIPPCLAHLRTSSLFLPYSELHLVSCQMSLFATLIGMQGGVFGGAGNAAGEAAGSGQGGGGGGGGQQAGSEGEKEVFLI